jgi:hypothetical protein
MMTERDFWAQASGLTPVDEYNIQEHQRAAWQSLLGSQLSNYDDLRYTYFSGETGLSGDIDSIIWNYWLAKSGLGEAGLPLSVTDLKGVALTLDPTP